MDRRACARDDRRRLAIMEIFYLTEVGLLIGQISSERHVLYPLDRAIIYSSDKISGAVA